MSLGCGFGWFCRWMVERGATSASGIDVSANMVARSRDVTGNTRIVYMRSNLEHLDLPADSFDLAYSSLALQHYVENLTGRLSAVHRSLRAGM